MANLTIIILTKNEEKNLEKCIVSFRGIAQRIVVVDSYSMDNTVRLAKHLGACVYQHPFETHAAQFNWALEHTDIQTEWIMKIDADEELTPELANEIEESLSLLPERVNGIILRRRVYFMGRWLKHGGKYPELLLRIFRRGHGMSEMKMMDEHLVVTDGGIVTFHHDFLDKNNKSLEWWISKHNWYSDKEVYDQQLRQGKTENDENVENTATSLQAKTKRFFKTHGYYYLPILYSFGIFGWHRREDIYFYAGVLVSLSGRCQNV